MSLEYLVVRVGGVRVGLPLAVVERVVPACELVALTDAPSAVIGAFNLHGRPVAVVDIRPRLGLARQALGVDDFLLLVDTGTHRLGVVIEDALGIESFPGEAIVQGSAVGEGIPPVPGLVAVDEGLMLAERPERFLSPVELSRVSTAVDALNRVT